MYRKLMFLISLVALLVLSNGTYADTITWDGGGAGDSFCTPENWEGDVLPGLADRARMGYRSDGENLCVVDCAHVVDNFRMPGDGGDPCLTVVNIVSGGHLEANGASRAGGGDGVGEQNVSGNGMLTIHGEYRFFDGGQEGWLNVSDNAAIVVDGRWRMGDNNVQVHINVSGGTIWVGSEYWRLGDDGGGTVDISGGSINVDGQIRWICRQNTQIINVTGGEQWCASTYEIGGSTGGKDPAVYCEMNMSGGIINAGSVDVGGGYEDTTLTVTGGQFISRGRFRIRKPANDTAQVNLNGGIIQTDSLEIAAGTNLNIQAPESEGGPVGSAGGTLILEGNQLTLVGTLRDAGTLTGCGSARGLVADYGVRNPGRTTVTATCDFDECQAWAPNPANGAAEVQSVITLVELGWREGDCIGARGRNAIYFGDNYDAVNTATPADPPFVTYNRAGATTHTVGNLPLWETFYWRIDEYNSVAGKPPQTKGKVWAFTTGCAAIVGDINMDCLVNFLDYAELANTFGQEEMWPE